MNRFQAAVQEFHLATGGMGTIHTQEGRELRAKLIMEEAVETVAALGFDVGASIYPNDDMFGKDPIAVFHKIYDKFHLLDFIDGLCDLTYVVMGGAVNIPIRLDRHFEEVHAANMRKLTGPKRADGKQLKPEGWTGPDHQRIIETYTYNDSEPYNGVPHG